MDYNYIANLIAITALLPVGLFIFFYGTKKVEGKRFRRPSTLWASTPIGRVLMSQKISWFIFLVFVLSSIYLDFPGQGILRICVYTLLVVQFWLVFRVLRHTQKTKPQKPETILPHKHQSQK